MKKQTALDRILNEKILFGGMVYTRRQVLAIMRAEGHDDRAIDYFTFHPNALPDETPCDDLLPEDAIKIASTKS